MPELRANGLDIHYLVEGQGPPLVLLHGATSSGTHDWGAQRPLLRRERTLYLPDARGHGQTRWDPHDGWDPAWLVDDLLAFVDALELERFALMGLSMGAVTALGFATQHPQRLEAAVFASAATEREPASSVARARLDPRTIERDDPEGAQQLADRLDPVQGPGGWRELTLALRDQVHARATLTPEQLRRVRLPVLIVNGDRDPWVPLEQAVKLHRQLPDARLLVLPGSGHVVQAEQSAMFNQAVSQFLRQVGRT